MIGARALCCIFFFINVDSFVGSIEGKPMWLCKDVIGPRNKIKEWFAKAILSGKSIPITLSFLKMSLKCH